MFIEDFRAAFYELPINLYVLSFLLCLKNL